MAYTRWRGALVVCCALQAVFSTADTTPAVAFPFNSQVPKVARVGEEYTFEFSATTFAPTTSNFTYSLSNQPAWLSVNSATRTLSGEPSQVDVGASNFTLTAADSSGEAHMPCTLVVSADPAPQIEWAISEQLETAANLSSSQPPVVTILPSSQFHFAFRQDSFIDIVQRKLTYYATLTDHTPLPSWLLFNPLELTFSGIVPQLSAFPQSWNIDLIASDVEGFAGAAASFTISVATQRLVFVPEKVEVDAIAGTQLNFTGLQDALFMNGNKFPLESLVNAQTSAPTWLSLDKKTLVIAGQVPNGVQDQNFTVTVVDKFGNQATTTVALVTKASSLFQGQVGTLIAHSGQRFSYHFPGSLFTNEDISLMVTLSSSAKWLQFDSNSRILSGEVPVEPSLLDIPINLTATASTIKDSQSFTIHVQPTSAATSSGKSRSSTVTTKTGAVNSSELAQEDRSSSHLSGGVVAAIVVAAVITAFMIVGILMVCLRRRRRKGYVNATSPAKRTISRPILPSDVDAITVTTEVQTDIEKVAGKAPEEMPQSRIDNAPQLALNLPSHTNSKRSKWSKRISRISQASSLGNGEDAIRADSNIPEWGRDSAALHAPHDSFSVPAEIARSSRQSTDLSPSKRLLRRLREKRQSGHSIGLGIDTTGANLMPTHNPKRSMTDAKVASSVGLSGTWARSSMASFSTRGTSVLSTRPSEFPRPPPRSTFTGSRSIPALSLTEAEKRKSIRLIEPSDSIPDGRSLHEKRRSFIRNRASTSFASPLFAHGSRASSNTRQAGNGSMNGSSAGSHRLSKRARSHITTYSESSSLDPGGRHSRRFSARIRSAFAPSFPRPITGSSLRANGEQGVDDGDSGSEYYTTSSSISDVDLMTEMALPRHQRSWVLPGEASPTPPPAPPTSRQASSSGKRTSSIGGRISQQKWKGRVREHSSSPLATARVVSVADRDSPSVSVKASRVQKSRLSETLSLVSNDSLSHATKLQRPRLVHTPSKRPVSVEKVRRLSSLKAETEDARPGSEMWEAMEGAGLMPPNSSDANGDTQKSNMSGPAFL